MKGNLQKDFLVMRANMKLYGLIFLFILLVMMLTNRGEGSVVSACAGAVAAFVVMTIVNSFAYDDRAGWDAFAFTLPVARRDMVRGKYLFALTVNAIGVGTAMVIGTVVCLARRTSPTEAFSGGIGGLAAGLLLTALLLPVLYRFGPQRMIVILFPLFGIIGVIAVGGYLASEKLPAQAITPELVLIVGLILLAVLLLGSYWISCRICQRKEA